MERALAKDAIRRSYNELIEAALRVEDNESIYCEVLNIRLKLTDLYNRL